MQKSIDPGSTDPPISDPPAEGGELDTSAQVDTAALHCVGEDGG